MTKEEIQKNSEHWYNKYKDAEKRITDLENKIADIKANCDLAIEGRDIKIKELELELTVEKDLHQDEELAEEYYYKTYHVTLNIGEEERKKEVTDIFLAGLKAGRPQWHDLRKDKNDLPKRNNELTDRSDVVITDKGIAHYNFRKQKWYVHNFECDMSFSETVIAWCEIPTFDKE